MGGSKHEQAAPVTHQDAVLENTCIQPRFTQVRPKLPGESSVQSSMASTYIRQQERWLSSAFHGMETITPLGLYLCPLQYSTLGISDVLKCLKTFSNTDYVVRLYAVRNTLPARLWLKAIIACLKPLAINVQIC